MASFTCAHQSKLEPLRNLLAEGNLQTLHFCLKQCSLEEFSLIKTQDSLKSHSDSAIYFQNVYTSYTYNGQGYDVRQSNWARDRGLPPPLASSAYVLLRESFFQGNFPAFVVPGTIHGGLRLYLLPKEVKIKSPTKAGSTKHTESSSQTGSFHLFKVGHTHK